MNRTGHRSVTRSVGGWLYSRPAHKMARCWTAVGLIVALLLAGCGTGAPTDLLPKAGTVAGWTPAGDVQAYDRDSLYDLVDGQADSFFAYGFEQAAVQSYSNGSGTQVRITLWQLASPADAYGLLTTTRSGVPLAIGNEGDTEPGQRIGFWQGRYYVDLIAQSVVTESDLQVMAEAVAARLPRGGQRPPVMDRLPAEGLAAPSPVFFHEEISIQDRVWLGGQNLLGLSSLTDGAVAQYQVGAETAWLLVVQYPNASAAAAGLAALRGSQMEAVAAAEARGELLAAVFGPIDTAAAGRLLSEALGR